MHAASQLLKTLRVGDARFEALRAPMRWPRELAIDGRQPEPALALCLVEGGQAMARAADGSDTLLRAGDLGVFRCGLRELWVPFGSPTPEATGLVAQVQVDAASARMLFAAMPPAVVLPLARLCAGAWIEAGFRHAVACAATLPPPAGLKLAEAFLAELLPDCVARAGAAGWLAAADDRIVGRVLAAIHAEPARDWTVEGLAREAHTSRSVLAERFHQLVGVPPIQYLSDWRLALAARLLTTSETPLVRIADDVGYRTDAAFSRAFRRRYGMPPATWRRANTNAGRMNKLAGRADKTEGSFQRSNAVVAS